jgi:basic membrane protein A and related proteins
MISRRNSLAALSGIAASLMLSACGQKEAPKKVEAPAPAPVAAAPAPAPKPEPLKMAWVYIGPVGDHGWTYAHDLGRKAVEKEFGDKVKTSIVEKVPEGADTERVVRDLAAQGNKMIFATSFGYGEGMMKVASDPAYKDVKFEHATGYKTAPNLRVYQVRMYESAYLAGIVAGKVTKTNKLGFVGSIPIPEVLRNANAFLLGAQSVNPKATLNIVWINSWFDPGKEKEAAEAMIAQGADVLIQNTDSTAVVQTAEAKGKKAFGWDSDMSSFAPTAHLGSAVINWGPYYVKATKEALDGTWKEGSYLGGLKEGLVGLEKVNPGLPQDVRDLVAAKSKEIADGTFLPFSGPIIGQDGKERAAKGASLDAKAMDSMDYLVKGVTGKLPAKK